MNNLDSEMMERYELYLVLKKEMDKVYRYRWPTPMCDDTTRWMEGVDKLSVILWKHKESWIEKPELIEEV